jgi:hypothetical protein
LIKALEKNVLWTSCRHDGALVHYVAVYIPPADTHSAREVMRALRWIIYRLFTLEKKPNIVIAGDFNSIAIKDTEFLRTLGLERVIADGVPTHTKGNTLDGIWTNLKVTSCILTDALPDITDHSLC